MLRQILCHLAADSNNWDDKSLISFWFNPSKNVKKQCQRTWQTLSYNNQGIYSFVEAASWLKSSAEPWKSMKKCEMSDKTKAPRQICFPVLYICDIRVVLRFNSTNTESFFIFMWTKKVCLCMLGASYHTDAKMKTVKRTSTPLRLMKQTLNTFFSATIVVILALILCFPRSQLPLYS